MIEKGAATHKAVVGAADRLRGACIRTGTDDTDGVAGDYVWRSVNNVN